MVRTTLLSLWFFPGLFFGYGTGVEAQERPDLHVVVNMVQLNVAVTDKKGNYVTAFAPRILPSLRMGLRRRLPHLRKATNRPIVSPSLQGPNDPRASPVT
jgi:hypothetical protein